ncbi:MAG: glycerol-3-phosphate 1-O-acyltransferase PlsY [Kiritimatiellae bacterium]|nr:glycerol-3-phosphate 1-O-acyltransferase PlsY [Kiritimatiellia bacterium]MDD5520933.1 glycerol-3-phosphate 1-O-acyltransferase PlsY [Kiritimatiellia bacterium]
MRSILVFIICGAVSYLLGAIPFGYIIARAKGVDLYKTGSGSIGATNVLRSVGRKWGYLTFVLDTLKGFVPAFLFPRAAAVFTGEIDTLLLALICSALAVAGHNWPVYLGFKGGKGIATSAGALTGIVPMLVVAGLITWAVVFLATRYVSLASMVAAIVLVVAGWLLYYTQGLLLPVALTILGSFAIWRHRSNIQRLINGTEHRFDFRNKKSEQQPGMNEKQ